MQIERTIEETASADTCAVFVERLVPGGNNCLVLREAEVVIGAQHDHSVVFHLHDRCLTALQFVEIGINT